MGGNNTRKGRQKQQIWKGRWIKTKTAILYPSRELDNHSIDQEILPLSALLCISYEVPHHGHKDPVTVAYHNPSTSSAHLSVAGKLILSDYRRCETFTYAFWQTVCFPNILVNYLNDNERYSDWNMLMMNNMWLTHFTYMQFSVRLRQFQTPAFSLQNVQ